MKRAIETLKLASEHLEKCGVVSARRVAEELLSSVLKCTRVGLYMQFDQPLLEEELVLYRGYISRAAKHEPYEYILKEVSFFECSIKVSPSVLIPRQETEILLDKVCKIIEEGNLDGKVAWDVCCGSGCLGIGLKKALPALEVTLSDLSQEALDVAAENCRRNQVEVTRLQGNLLEPFSGKKADFVLCNPPYVTEEEYSKLDLSVSGFEPKMALVSGSTGLEFYERLNEDLPPLLNPSGKVFLEMGNTQGERVNQIFSHPLWKRKEILQDCSGKDRFFFLERE